MNASTETRLKIMKGQKNFDINLVRRLLAEHDELRKANASLRGATLHHIGGHTVVTENGLEVCEPIPVVTLKG